MDVLQRTTWSRTPRDLGECFRLTKGRSAAVCTLRSQQFGWELELHADGEFLQSKVCRAEEDVFATFEEWKAAMITKGWG